MSLFRPVVLLLLLLEPDSELDVHESAICRASTLAVSLSLPHREAEFDIQLSARVSAANVASDGTGFLPVLVLVLDPVSDPALHLSTRLTGLIENVD